MTTRGCTPPCFARRKFLLAFGAGVPILGAGCIDSEFDDFRDGEIDFGNGGELPYNNQGLAPQLSEVEFQVDVESTTQDQSFKNDKFSCSVSKSMPGVQIGDQVRVRRNGQNIALYTVAQRVESDAPNIVRMGTNARKRLGTSNTFAATLGKPAPAGGMTDVQAEAGDDFVERLSDDGNNDGLIVLAPHGGGIEPHTDPQAKFVADALGCSSWICKGYKSGGGGYERWHVTSTKISPRSFPGLKMISNRGFAYAVSFHGMADDGVLIGGGAPLSLKTSVKTAIKDALGNNFNIRIAGANDDNGGKSAKSVHNWLTADGLGGIQIEQGMDVRGAHWQAVAEAVSGMYSQLI